MFSGLRFVLSSILFMTLATTFGFSAAAKAEATEALDTMSLEELMNVKVYSASKREETIRSAPNVVTVITPEQLKHFGLRTVHEALSLVPGFDIQKQLRKEYHWTRGVREAALILIDGTSILNPADNEAYLDEAFQIENIKRIEVIRGPGGVIWGTNAFLGVVNVITKDPTQSPFASVNASYGSYNAKRAGFAVSTTVGEWGLWLSGKHLDTQKNPVKIQMQDKSARQDVSYYTDIHGKIKWRDWTLSVREDDHKEYAPMSDLASGTSAGAYTDTTFYERDPTDLYQLNFDKELSSSVTFHGKAALLKRDIEIVAPRSPNGVTPSTIIYDNIKADRYTFDFQFDHKLEDTRDLIWGTSYQRVATYENDVKTGGTVTKRGLADARIHNYSGFAQLTEKFTEQFTGGVGLRGELIEQQFQTATEAGLNTRRSDPQGLFNLNLAYFPTSYNHLKLIAAKGVRQPDIEQSSSATASFNGSDVQSEQAYTYEAEYYHQLSSDLGASVNYSYNDIYGLIDFINSAPGVYTSRNLPHAIVQTWEGELRYTAKSGSYGFTNFTYKDGKRPDGAPIAGIDNTSKFNMNLAYAHKLSSNFFVSNVFRYVGKKKDNYQLNDGSAPVATPIEREVSDWVTWDIGLILGELVTGLDARLFVYNVLDQNYFMQNRVSKFGYLHEQPGRNFDFQLTYNF